MLCNLKGFEITPFYVWGMYSGKESKPTEYPVYKIIANDKLVDYSTGYFAANRFFLTSPLSYYESLKGSGDPTFDFLKRKLKGEYYLVQPYTLGLTNSQKAINEFPDWYRKYLEQTTGQKIRSVKVDVLNISWQTDDSIAVNSVYNLIDEK